MEDKNIICVSVLGWGFLVSHQLMKRGHELMQCAEHGCYSQELLLRPGQGRLWPSMRHRWDLEGWDELVFVTGHSSLHTLFEQDTHQSFAFY